MNSVTASNQSWKERGLRLFPGGSNGEFGLPEDLVRVLERGAGCRVWDTDGLEYLDYTMAWGSALVGHAHPKVVEAATRAAADGLNFAAINRRAVELAERIRSLSRCAERLRFVASGTEATMLCLRVAQAATLRSKVLRFEGAYHGQHPVGVAGMLHSRNSALPTCDPAGAGAAWVERDVLVAPYNHWPVTSQILEDHASEIAAVIVEPLHRCLTPKAGFLEGLREATRRHGIVLVFDEVVTGFRLAPGGAQEYYGVTPDLVAYGKALGGGYPLGAYGGRADLMEVVNEQHLPGPHYAWSASTTGGNPVSCAAALAALEVLTASGVHENLHTRGRDLRARMAAVLQETRTPGQVLGDGPLAQVAFSATPVEDQAGWLKSDRARGRAVMFELFCRGVFLNPMGTKLYLSIDHGTAEIEAFADRFRDALAATAPR